MPSIDSMTAVLVSEMRDLYDAEKRLTKAIPKMSKKAANRELRTALNDHLKETRQQVRRLEQAFRHLGETPRARPCVGMRGIVQEGNEHVGEDFSDDSLRDTMIIGAAQRVEHYEMAAYIGAISHARVLGLDSVKELLEETLEEEKAADKKLTAIAESRVHVAAPMHEGDITDAGDGSIAGSLAGLFTRRSTPARKRSRKRSSRKR